MDSSTPVPVPAPAKNQPATTAKLPSAFELFKPSWAAVKLNLMTFLELSVVPIILSLIAAIAGRHSGGPEVNPLIFLSIVLSLVLVPASLITQLKSLRGETIDFSEALKEGLHYFWRLLGLGLLMGLVIGLGLILFIVPGLIMLRRYILAPYYVVDQNMKILDAMKASAADSKPHSSAVWGLIGVEVLFALPSAVPVIGRLLGAILPFMYSCAPALRYQQIKAASGGKS